MVLNAAAQALRQAEDLKKKILQGSDSLVPSTNRTLSLTQLQKAYQKVLLIDLDYALDKKVEQDLWNVGFKNQIELLQNNAKDKKNPRRAENQTLLLWVLQAATGFYICLLHQICTTFKLNLPFRCNIPYPWGDAPFIPSRPPQASSCWYICQHCLVHLGDLARYSRQPRRADSFYRQALMVSPRNGQPYNQLGLLRAARGDRLGAAYYHARGLAVGGPFPPAANNLSRALAAAEGSVCVDSPYARLSGHAYTGSYMALHHRLQSVDGLSTARQVLPALSSTLTALVATDQFSSDAVIKMVCLDLYAIYSVTDGHKLLASALTGDESEALSVALELVAGTMAALLLPAHTRAAEEMLTYPALPAVKVLLEWLKIHPYVLKDPAFVSRLQLWPGLCTLLNTLQQTIKDFSGQEYEMVPLPEDEELQGYLPIDPAFSKLKFLNAASSPNFNIGNTEHILPTTDEMEGTSIREILAKRKSGTLSNSDVEALKKDQNFMDSLRAYRLIQLGEWLASEQKENGTDYITLSVNDGLKVFTPIQNSPENNQELQKVIEELSLLREKRLLDHDSQLSETISNSSQRDADDNMSDSEGKGGRDGEEEGSGDHAPPIVISEADFREKVAEKRAGILKPQGSLERARGEKAALSRAARVESPTPASSSSDLPGTVTPECTDNQDTASSCSTVSQDGNICTDVGSLLEPPGEREAGRGGRRGRTNVALQAIMRKQEESSKQVKFLTPVTTPDSIGEPSQLSPLSSKDHGYKKKILQPKVIKSLASLPTDRKTGGILSLKDKSAGYPHLVNVEPTTSETQEQTTIGDDAKNAPKPHESKQLNMANQHAEFGKYPSSPAKNSAKVLETSAKPVKESVASNSATSSYIPWSDGTSASKPEDKYPYRFQNIPQQNKPNFSLFSAPDAQNTSITLPVVNPKEIDIRSVALQRQKSMQNSNEAMIDQYNKESMPQYNYWYGSPSNPNQHSPGLRDATGRHASLPPRLANLKKPKNAPEFTNRLPEHYRYEGMNSPQQNSPKQQGPTWNTNSQQPQTTWWKPSNHEPNYDTTYQPQNLSYAHSYYGNASQQNMAAVDYQDPSAYSQRNQPNIPPQNYPERNYNHNAYSQSMNYSQFNPYNPGMYPQFSSKFGFSQQPVPKPSIGHEYSLSPYPNASQFGLAQNAGAGPSGEAGGGMHGPPDVPRGMGEGVKYEGMPPTGRSDAGMDMYKQYGDSSSNTYSLFSGGSEAWAQPMGNMMPQQSLWSGPGPSPLERLLEQQKLVKVKPHE